MRFWVLFVSLKNGCFVKLHGLDILFLKSRDLCRLLAVWGQMLIFSFNKISGGCRLGLVHRIDVYREFLLSLKGIWGFTWESSLKIRCFEHTILLLIHIKFNYICNAFISKLCFYSDRSASLIEIVRTFSSFQIWQKSGL